MATNPFNYNIPIPKRDGSNTFNFQEPKRTPTDTVQLGDFTLPGISTVEVIRERKAHIQRRKGGRADTLVDSGLNLARVIIKTNIFFKTYNKTDDANAELDVSDFDSMGQIVDYLENKIGIGNSNDENGLQIVNPITRIRKVFNVYVESISGPVNYMPPGRQEWIFNCIEVQPKKDTPPKVVKQPKGPVKVTAPVNAEFKPLLPSQDPAKTGPRITNILP